MNRSVFRILSLLLCAAMVFSLAACGKGSDDTKPETGTEAQPTTSEYAYLGSFTPIKTDSQWGVTPFLYTDDGFYATAQVVVGRQPVPEGQVEEYDGQYDIRCYQYGANDEILQDAILKGDYDPATDTITAEGFFDPDAPFTVTFSYNENNEVVWTENGESTVLEYSYRTE